MFWGTSFVDEKIFSYLSIDGYCIFIWFKDTLMDEYNNKDSILNGTVSFS